MGIDGIGKGGGARPPIPASDGKDVGSIGAAQKPEKAFGVDKAPSTKDAASVDATSATTPLARLRAGEIDVNGYVDLKVDEATASLKGVPAAELEEIKRVLRDQLRTDPGLVDLVRSATGKAPSPPEE